MAQQMPGYLLLTILGVAEGWLCTAAVQEGSWLERSRSHVWHC